MAHFAELDDNNIVLRVIVVRNENVPNEAAGIAFCQELCDGGRWVQTSYNTFHGIHTLGGTPLRKNYAYPGYLYDEARDAFIEPQPFPSWTLNEQTCSYDPPIPYPSTAGLYEWNESQYEWVAKAL